ncbi:MAG: TadE/TadG family type IV pilus assembly protein [Asticcacaulis sp.]
MKPVRLAQAFLNRFLVRYGRDEGGNVMMIFGLSAVVLFSAVGGAIDFSRVEAARRNMQDAADAAILRTMSMSTASDAQRAQAADDTFHQNFSNGDTYGMTAELVRQTQGRVIDESYVVKAQVTSCSAACSA